jgi:hypothetical protein
MIFVYPQASSETPVRSNPSLSITPKPLTLMFHLMTEDLIAQKEAIGLNVQ